MLFKEYPTKMMIDGREETFRFFSYSGLSYFMGASVAGLRTMESKGMIPVTPFILEKTGRFMPAKLFLRAMIKETVDLYEVHCPIPYKGRTQSKRDLYLQYLAEYKKKVKSLEDKWKNEKEEYLRNDLKSR